MAAFFSSPFCAPQNTGFTPLFRLLDDFESYSRETQEANNSQNGNGAAQSQRQNGPHRHQHHGGPVNRRGVTGGRRFSPFARPAAAGIVNPSFDVRETETTYELHGDLPGVAKEDVHISFTEPQTLNIKGSVRRNYTAGTPPSNWIEQQQQQQQGLPEQEQQQQQQQQQQPDDDQTMNEEEDGFTGVERVATPTSDHYRPASVADEETEAARERGEPVESEKDEQSQKQQAEQEAVNEAVAAAIAAEAPKEKFWVSERSFGDFSRTFTFPARVDTTAVSARLENGVLSVTVPKQKVQEPLRIAIN